MAEGGGVEVEGDAEGVGLLLRREAQQRGQKAEDGVGVESVPRRQGPDAVIGPVENAVSVNGHELHRDNLQFQEKSQSG